MKDKILRTTAKLIAKNGVHSTSTRVICAELGITAPTLYYHFADKSELFAAVIDHAFERHFEKIRNVRKAMEPVEFLKGAWDAYMGFVIEEPDLFSIMVASILNGKIPPSGAKCFDSLAEGFAAPELKGRLDCSPKKAAMIYLSAAQGRAIFALAEKGMSLQHDTRDAILRALIQNH